MACWNLPDMGGIIQELLPSADSFQQMLFDLSSKLHDQQRQLAAMTLWSLWKSRYLLFWGDNDNTPILTITRAQDVLHEWSCVQKAKHLMHHDNLPPAWEKPPHCSIKCNVDAALFILTQLSLYILFETYKYDYIHTLIKEKLSKWRVYGRPTATP